MKILVLGAGRMGLGAAYDLATCSNVVGVTIADIDIERAEAIAAKIGSPKLTTTSIDVNDYRHVIDLMSGHDAVISCVVYSHNLALSRAAIEARVNFCDLGGNNSVVSSQLALNEAAREAGINIIPDCGLAPGMVSVLVARGASRFEQLDAVHIRVGALPQNPKPPLDYQIVFSVEGLINEYVEKARVLRNGEIIEIDSMTDIEHFEFAPIGRLEAFQTSGGVSTLPERFLGRAKDLDYKTIRYPGHCEKFKLLIDLGLTSSRDVTIAGSSVSPRRVLGEALLRNLPSDEPDIVLVRIEFVGTIEGRKRTLYYDLIDRYDEQTGLSAMMRTTAFPASIIAQMMASGETTSKGALPQELCIKPEPFVQALTDRAIHIVERII